MKACTRDRQAWDELYRRTEPELRKLAMHWIRRYHAKDVVRTTELIDQGFVKLMQIHSPDWPHRGAFYVFACRNIFCVLIDMLRQRRPQPTDLPDGIPAPVSQPTDLPDGIPAPDCGLTQHTLLTLQGALEELGQDLSETHRVVVELRFLGECTLDEVAKLLSVNRDKAFKMSKVALLYLREKLKASFPELDQSLNCPSGG
jgi:RNA polymerase sigma factor (sigma-70 family)